MFYRMLSKPKLNPINNSGSPFVSTWYSAISTKKHEFRTLDKINHHNIIC